MKKVIALALASAMAVGMGTTVFAASGNKYTEMTKPLGYSYSGGGLSTDLATLDMGTINADQDEIELPLIDTMFDVNGVGKALSASDIRSSKVVVRSQVKAGSKVLKDVSLNTKKGQVEVDFVDEWVSTKSQDFEVFVYLTLNGKRQDDNGLTILGTLENDVIEVYDDYDYVDLSDGDVAHANDFVKNIEVDLGNGVSIFTKFFKDKKYYGIASREPDEADDVVFAKYPDIDNVVTLKTVGLNSTGDIVRLDTDFGGYYVYDSELNFLGMSDEMLPYSTKYYLANKQLDIVEEETEETEAPEETDETDETEEESSESNTNNNANPGTGR